MSKDQGAILPLVAVTLLAIISMLVLVIDYGTLVTTKSDLRETARAAAMAGLQAYVNDLNARINHFGPPAGVSDPIYAQALQSAVDKASFVAKLNLEVSKSTGFREGDADSQSSIGLQNQSKPGGFLQPGKWHFIEGSTRPACSPPVPAPFVPCFEELPPNQAANAIRVFLSDQTDKVKSTFSEVVDIALPNVSDFGTAAFVPRQGVVAFDLSTSTTRVSHLEADSSDGKRSEYAFYVEPGSSCGGTWQTGLQASHQEVWNAMPSHPPGATKDHFKSNYECMSLNVDSTTESFAIEKNGNPQPLNSILDATHQLLDSFASRRVVGDKVGAFGFDLNVLPQRRLPENPISGVILSDPIHGEAIFDDFYNATNTSLPISQRKDKFLFPRVYAGSGSDRKVALTNVQDALIESLNMLKSSKTFEVSDNFVLLVTDGLSNCVEDLNNAPLKGPDTDGDGKPDPIKCFNTSDPNFYNYNEMYIKAGFKEIYDGSNNSIAKSFQQDRVKVHVALVGQEVAPHSLVRKSESGGCMSFDEARAANLTMVDATDIAPYSPQNNFYFPNNFANLSAVTGGKWAPIRPGCSAALTQDSLDSFCDAQPNSNPILPNMLSGHTFSSDEWDNKGRLLCAPGGLTIGEQLNDLVKQIMADAPIVIVE